MSAFNLSREQIKKAIADVAHREWEPNGSREEGYSIMVAREGEGFYFNNIIMERLRLRLNTLDRLFNPESHRPFVLWRVKNYQGGVELRFIYGGESAYNYRENEHVRLYDDSDGNPHDGMMTFAAYLFRVAYTSGIGHSKESRAYDGDDAITDLANDFVDDQKSQYIFDGQKLYDDIFRRACSEAVLALNKAVKDYRKFCDGSGLKSETINIRD